MKLLNNQSEAKTKLLPRKVGALFMKQGSGKTRVAVELVNSVPEVDLVAWIGPLNTIRPKEPVSTIIDEITKWGGFHAPTEFVGIESISQSDRMYLDLHSKIRKARCPFIVVDESLKIKNAEAKRTRRMLDLSEMAEYKLVLNGTPLSRNLLDLKPQMDFLSPRILGMSNAEFKNTFCEYTTVTKRIGRQQYTKEFITGYENIDHLYALIKHYVYECDLDLRVEQYYSDLNYSIDAEALNQYDYLKRKYLDNETLMWKNKNIFLEMTQKMQHSYCCTPSKFEALDDWFTSHDQERTIIFCKYVKSREACERYFPKATALSYQKHAFGLNMQHLNQTVYFDKIWDWALRNQSINRTFRTGQEQDCYFLDLTGDVGLEALMDRNITTKTSMVEYFKGKTKEEIKAEL